MPSATLALVPPLEGAGSTPRPEADDGWDACTRAVAGTARWETRIAIDGIHCAACTLVIEQALLQVPGVHSVQVNAGAATARVEWTRGAGGPQEWLAALRRAGYSGLPAGSVEASRAREQAARKLLWRWLVAGFCMMQVMMYAFPAYVAEPGEIGPDAQALLRWASWMMTLPVVLFSCRPFFASAWRDLRNARAGMDVPVSLGIAIAFVASTVATFATLDPSASASVAGGEVWFDSVTMVVFFLLSGRLLEQRLRDCTAGSLEALVRRMPATVLRECADGRFERVAIRRLRVGDRVRVLAGEAFPADGTVLEGTGQVDEALLTGESTPLRRGPGDAVIAGSHNLAGPLLMRVERTGDDTRFAAIVALVEQAAVDKPRLAVLADRIAGPFLLAVLAAAAAAAWWWWPRGPEQALGIAVAVLIVTCPCALSLATPAATLAAAGSLARRGILVRRIDALETAASIDAVVFDKTGTLTRDGMAVTGLQVRPGVAREQALALAAALASQSLHPASRAIMAAAGASALQAHEVRESAGQGVEGVVRDAAREVSPRLKLGSAAFCGVSGNSSSQVHLADGQGWLASFELQESLRDEVPGVVARLKAQGTSLRLLSGDRPAAVRRLAGRAGIGDSLGGQSPEDKLAQLQSLQRAGRRVAMVGDGINDGPVLARADLSFAMGRSAPIAQARADIVVPGGNLSAVPDLLALARRTRRVVRQNLGWAAAYNAVCVPLALVGWMPPWAAGLGMACSSLFVVLNAARLSFARTAGDRGPGDGLRVKPAMTA